MNPKDQWKKLRKEEREKNVLAAGAKIKETVLSSEGGRKCDSITGLLENLRSAVAKGNAYYEIPVLEGWCDKYFSDRKHLKQPGGLPQIRQQILQSLDEIEYHVTEED